MRSAVLLLLIPASCARKSVDHPAYTPDAFGGGPAVVVVPTIDARTTIARAHCAASKACEDVELDACVTREEATMPDWPCVAVDRARVTECVEATRAKTCTDTAAPPECDARRLCSKEDRP